MNIIENPWKHVILRALVISGIGVLVGSIFYRSSVFIPTMRPFQFTVSSISAGIAYAFSEKFNATPSLACTFYLVCCSHWVACKTYLVGTHFELNVH